MSAARACSSNRAGSISNFSDSPSISVALLRMESAILRMMSIRPRAASAWATFSSAAHAGQPARRVPVVLRVSVRQRVIGNHGCTGIAATGSIFS